MYKYLHSIDIRKVAILKCKWEKDFLLDKIVINLSLIEYKI